MSWKLAGCRARCQSCSNITSVNKKLRIFYVNGRLKIHEYTTRLITLAIDQSLNIIIVALIMPLNVS